MMEIQLNLPETIAFASAILWLGTFLCARIPALKKYDIPAAVVGGVLFALASWGLKDYCTFNFDMMAKDPLMIAFFTTVGLAASLKTLKKGGRQVFIFLIVSTIVVVLQDVLSVVLSYAINFNPFLGLLGGSITMTGGMGTGAVYAQLFEKTHGLKGCMELAMAAATFGMVMGSVIGGPVARRLILKNNLSAPKDEARNINYEMVEENEPDEPVTPSVVMITIMQITIAMAIGSVIFDKLASADINIPTYLCALFIGIFIRNISDLTGAYKVHLRLADTIGSVSLSLFLALALMSLKLWQLVGLAGPMAIILAGQTIMMALYAYFVTFRAMGRDYTAAVIAGGHCGFGLGATANAIANMDAITATYGPSPQAFFVVSIVGAFFVDIVNAVVIQSFVNLL